MPEAGAGGQGHDLLWSSVEPFYAQAVSGSTCRYRMALHGARARAQKGRTAQEAVNAAALEAPGRVRGLQPLAVGG